MAAGRKNHDRMVGLGCMGILVVFVLLCICVGLAVAWRFAP